MQKIPTLPSESERYSLKQGALRISSCLLSNSSMLPSIHPSSPPPLNITHQPPLPSVNQHYITSRLRIECSLRAKPCFLDPLVDTHQLMCRNSPLCLQTLYSSSCVPCVLLIQLPALLWSFFDLLFLQRERRCCSASFEREGFRDAFGQCCCSS